MTVKHLVFPPIFFPSSFGALANSTLCSFPLKLTPPESEANLYDSSAARRSIFGEFPFFPPLFFVTPDHFSDRLNRAMVERTLPYA